MDGQPGWNRQIAESPTFRAGSGRLEMEAHAT